MNKYTVFYKIHDRSFEDYIIPNEVNATWFNTNYREVKSITANSIEDVYSKMQGDNWSPNGEARELILGLGLSHTSMSIGDIVYSHSEDKYYWCSWLGFDEIALTHKRYYDIINRQVKKLKKERIKWV